MVYVRTCKQERLPCLAATCAGEFPLLSQQLDRPPRTLLSFSRTTRRQPSCSNTSQHSAPEQREARQPSCSDTSQHSAPSGCRLRPMLFLSPVINLHDYGEDIPVRTWPRGEAGISGCSLEVFPTWHLYVPASTRVFPSVHTAHF